MTENKRIRTCHKYHYDTVKICRETDVVCTICRVCKNMYPSTIEYFRKDKQNSERDIQPICRACASKKERMHDAEVREQKRLAQIEEQKPIWNVEAHSLFENTEETVESKVDRILAFLWLTRWQYKK